MGKNELAIIDTTRTSLIPSDEDMAAITEELKDIDVIPYGRIKIAAAGANVFKVTDPGEEDSKTATEIVGVVIITHKCNAYWPTKYGTAEAAKSPDCVSYDGVTGIVAATGECRACSSCPFNQYGSADSGRGKACKNMRRLYIMREGDIFPMVLSLPGTALKSFDSYRTRLVMKRKTITGVVTQITLKSAKNQDGIEYSTPLFDAVGALPADEIERVRAFAAQFEDVARRVDVSEEDMGRNDSFTPSHPCPINVPRSDEGQAEADEADGDDMPF